MKRIILLAALFSLTVLSLCGCDVLEKIIGGVGKDEHVHSGGEATCLAMAVCDECGNAYGEKADHNYSDATCEVPKTCRICTATDGEALGHSFSEATCTDAARCDRCGVKDTEALGHDYAMASCETPTTCKRCGHVRSNDALGHSYTATECNAPLICERCGDTNGETLAHKLNSYYSFDENEHWIGCEGCDERTSVGEHCGGEISGNERAKCSVCAQYYGEEPEIVLGWTIEAITPAEGSTFCLANSRIKTWYETFDFHTTDTDAHWLGADVFVPDVPVFRWSIGEDAFYYKVYISTTEDFSQYQCYLTSLPELIIEHLYTGVDYYWYVDAVCTKYTVRSEVFTFSTEYTPRTVSIDGVSNSRDIGGYITVDGKRIRQGLIYRSAKLDDITEQGRYTLLYELGVKTDLDLRGDRNDYYKNATHPVTELNHIVVACPWYSTGSNHIWMDDYNKAEFAKAIKVFADPDNYPILFHCSLGRDRTGTLAMVLEGLLGLDENTLMMEYELSVFSYWGTNGSTKYNNGLRNDIHNTYLYISNNYEGDTFSEKVEDFLLEIGVTAEEIASIKSIMLEEVE